ncbi:Pre-mRNA cleavage factor Im 25 kDa subunit 2-like protein [Drosera capensis]
MVVSSSSVVSVYPLSSYTFGTKEPKMEKDTFVADHLARMKVKLLQRRNEDQCGRNSTCKTDLYPVFISQHITCILYLSTIGRFFINQEHNHPHILLLQIGNTFCKLPGGRLKPGENEIKGLKRKLSSKLGADSPSLQPNWQECKKIFIVRLPERDYFAVPRNLKLLAVPRYGPVISTIPQQLSRFHFNMITPMKYKQ